MSTHTAIEQAFDEATQALTNAQRAFARSRSAKNRAALVAAMEVQEAAATTMRQEQERAERAETVSRRLALVAARRAQRAAQTDLFA